MVGDYLGFDPATQTSCLYTQEDRMNGLPWIRVYEVIDKDNFTTIIDGSGNYNFNVIHVLI